MNSSASPERWIIASGLVLLATVSLSGLLFLGLLALEHRSVYYPSANIVSETNALNPKMVELHLRRVAVYHTMDEFPDVMRWYRTHFELEDDVEAMGGCLHLFGSDRRIAYIMNISITICDTPDGRLIIVNRSNSLVPR